MGYNRLDMNSLFIFIIIIMSCIGEIIAIPILELNQVVALFLFLCIFLCRKHIKTYNHIFWLCLYIVFTTIVAVSSEYFNFKALATGVVTYTIPLMFMWMVCELDKSTYIRLSYKISLFLTILFFVESILYILNSSFYQVFFLEPSVYGTRPRANFLSPNSYAIVLCYLFIYWINMFFHSKIIFPKYKFCSLIMMFMVAIPFVNASSKGGLVVLIIGVILYCLTERKYLYCALIAMLAILLYFNLENVVEFCYKNTNIDYIRRLHIYLSKGDYYSGRGHLVHACYLLFKNSPVVGSGLNTSMQALTSMFCIQQWPHSEYMKIFVEGGVLGSIIWGIYIKSCCIFILRNRNNSIVNVSNIQIIFFMMFLVSLIFFNYFTTYREILIMIFYSYGMFCTQHKYL